MSSKSGDYNENYYGQMPKDRDGYGFPIYERQTENHYGEMPNSTDGYGNPTYNKSPDRGYDDWFGNSLNKWVLIDWRY